MTDDPFLNYPGLNYSNETTLIKKLNEMRDLMNYRYKVGAETKKEIKPNGLTP